MTAMKKLLGRFKERSSLASASGASTGARRSIDVAPQVIIASARSLVEGIEQILFDSGSLSGEDTSGFTKLISLIDSVSHSEEIHIISGSHGAGCVAVLLKHMHHASFIDCCAQANLAPALLHALRLLRMMEVKVKTVNQPPLHEGEEGANNDNDDVVVGVCTAVSVTRTASKKVCQLLVELCGSTQIMEQLRPSLTKLLCLPLSPLPRSGLHFQSDVAGVVEAICKSGLTSPIIWALRDSQTVLQMTRALRELTTIVESSSKGGQPDILLKGMEAEERGMWVVATSCLVELLNAADTFSPVLLTDFESSGGYDLMVHICLHSSVTRSMQILNSVIILLVGEAVDKPLMHPQVGGVLEQILRSVLSLPTNILTGDESVEDFVVLSSSIAETADTFNQMEYILQNLSYSLLTLYSSHPQNYVLLESVHFLLPMLTVSLPVVTFEEPLAAILKVLDFVCSERCDLLCVKAFCASASILAKMCISEFLTSQEDRRDISGLYHRFLQCISFSEDVMCKDTDYATVFLNHGLQPIFHESFCQISGLQECEGTDSCRFVVHERLVDMLVKVVDKHPTVCDEVARSGLDNLVVSLLSSKAVNTQFANILLKLPERLAKSDQNQYEPVLLSLMETVLSLGKDRAEDESMLLKLKCVIDCVGRVLAHGAEDAATVWSAVHGFESLIYVIDSLEMYFDGLEADGFAADTDKGYMCLQSVIECLAVALNTTSKSGYDSAHDNRMYFRRMIKYPKLSDALFKTGIFSSPFAQECVDLLFKLVSGCVCSNNNLNLLQNPDAFAVILDILPYLELTVAVSSISRVQDYTFSQIDGCQMFSEAGLIRLLVQKYDCVLRDAKHNLNLPLFNLLKSICERYFTAIDFKYVFQYLIRPDAISDEKNCQLLPVWKMEERKEGSVSERNWENLRMLIDLTESPSLASNAAYILLGPGAVPKSSTEHEGGNESLSTTTTPAHLHMKWSETHMGKAFPISSFSFTSWIQIGTGTREGVAGVDVKGENHGTIPIFAMRGEGGGVFELQFDTFSSNARFISRSKGGVVKTHSFSIPYIDESEWHLVVITMKKQKKMIKAAQVGLELFFDGQLIHSDKFDADKIPINGHVVDLYVGKTLVSEVTADDALVPNTENFLNLWHLGPVLLFDEALSQVQISRIMTKGASYTGSFQGDSPLEGRLSTRVTEVLTRCNSTFLDMDALLDALGLKGLELLVFFPQSENSRDSKSSLFENLPSIPTPIMAYNANSSFILKSKQSRQALIRIGLHNSASHFSITPHAELVRGWYFSRMDSVARCISTLGGPALLMPLVQAASTEDHIVMALDLLRSCLSQESSNLNYMHTTGFGVLSFLLSRKSKSLITEKVISALFSMAVDRGLKAATSSIFSILLVDTLAFNYLFLNHQIWDPLNPEYALLVMMNLKTLVCEDARHGTLNAKRLALMGVSRWIIVFLVFVIGECGKSESLYNDKGTSYKLSLTQLATVSNRSVRSVSAAIPAEEDDFSGIKYLIQTTVYVLRALMMMSLQHDDIDLITKVVSVSFTRDVLSDDTFGQRSRHYLRISFIRTLGEVYAHHRDMEGLVDKSETCKIYSQLLNPAWFLFVLEESHNISSVSRTLMLLGVMLQRDAQFRKAFCKYDPSLKLLHGIVSSEEFCVESNLSIVLPLIALLFQIPMKFVQNTDEINISQLLNLMDKCGGPLASEQEAKDFTIPILSILLTYFSQGARAHYMSKTSPPVQSTIIGQVLKHAMQTREFNGMRDIMQQRSAVEILASALLMSSNACEDYGTRLISTDEVDVRDLSMCLQEDYICVDSVSQNRERSSSATIDSRVITDDVKTDCVLSEVVLIVDEGEVLLELLDMVLRNAIFKYANPQLVCNFFLAFPSHMVETYVCGYHSLLFETVKTVLQSSFEEIEIGPLQTVCDVFTLLLPLAQAGFLHKTVLYDLLMMNLYGLDAVASPEASNWLGIEKHSLFLKELGSSARYLAILNFQKVMLSADVWEEKLSILQTVRSNFHLLCTPSFDEVTDSSMLKSRREVDLDKSTGAVSVIEVFNLSVSGDSGCGDKSKRFDSALQTTTTEKYRVSQVFCSYIASNAYSLFLDDEKKIRNEAMRLCCALLLHRRQFMTDLFSQRHSRRNSDFDDSELRTGPDLHEGFLKLIPSEVGGANTYSKLLRRINTNFEDEDKRIAEFSFWLTDNGNLCDLLFNSLDLTSSIASARHLFSTSNAIKDVICEKVKATSLLVTEGKQFEMNTEDEILSQQEFIAEEKRQWLIFGISEIARGALYWKDVWLCQQSCPVWGNAPTTSESTVYAIGGNEDSFDLTYTPYSGKSSSAGRGQSNKITWKLSSIGGPEKVCRRIEQDYETPPQVVPDDEVLDEIKEVPQDISPDMNLGDNIAHSDEMVVSSNADNNAQHSNIENFLLKISQNPLLRKASANKVEGADDEFNEDINEEDDEDDETQLRHYDDLPIDSEEMVERETFTECDRVSDMDDTRISGDDDGFLVEPPEDYNFDNDAASKRFSFRNFASNINGKGNHSNEVEQLTASQMDPVAMRRGGILVEIVRGIIGTEEWEEGQMLNIDR